MLASEGTFVVVQRIAYVFPISNVSPPFGERMVRNENSVGVGVGVGVGIGVGEGNAHAPFTQTLPSSLHDLYISVFWLPLHAFSISS